MVDTFHIVPSANKGMFLIVIPVGLLLVALIFLMVFVVHSSQRASFELAPEGLRLRGELLYRRFVPREALLADEARLVDLRSESGLAPRVRTFGTGMPGYAAGWFRLNNGKKALVYITEPSSVVVIPTNEDYSVMLSVTEPERLLARLRAVYGRS
jgi:hypothetical protein